MGVLVYGIGSDLGLKVSVRNWCSPWKASWTSHVKFRVEALVILKQSSVAGYGNLARQ